MRELARGLGISVSSVSLALRNDPRVAVETRLAVQEAARKAGYRLNPALTHYMSKVRHAGNPLYKETLAWLDFTVPQGHFFPEYLLDLWLGAKARAEALGYALDNVWMAQPGMTGKRMTEILVSRGIRGILVPPLVRSTGHLSLEWSRFATVALTYSLQRPRFHRVVPDHHNNLQMVFRELHRRGFRRPGLMLSRGYDERVGNRCRSAFAFFQESLASQDRLPVCVLPPTAFEELCAGWLKLHRPDVVVTLGAMKNLRKLDIGDPEYSRKLGVFLLGYASTDLGFSAINECPTKIGSTGVDQLVACLNRSEWGVPDIPLITMVPGAWMEGNTLTPQNLLVQHPVKT